MGRKQIKAWVSSDAHKMLSDLVMEAGYIYADRPAWGEFLEALANGGFCLIPKKTSKKA